jgi:hypothetical protein
MIFGREPVLYLAVVKAALVLVVAFGFDLSAGQAAAIYVLAEAVLALWARRLVTPMGAGSRPAPAGEPIAFDRDEGVPIRRG